MHPLRLALWSARWVFLCAGLALMARGSVAADSVEATLPAGVTAVWDLDRAWRESTSTRERVSLNGLWRWQPGVPGADRVPEVEWGFFKVPGSWPGITDYQQKDCQTVFRHSSWRETSLREVAAAWYERLFTMPTGWGNRRVWLHCDYLNSLATVHVDGVRAGEIRFPGGDLELTRHCRPGATHRLSVLVEALPLKAVMLSFRDTAAAREVQGTVERRGFCGDVELRGLPPGTRVAEVKVETSYRRSEISVSTVLEGLDAMKSYRLRARIVDSGRTILGWEGARFSGLGTAGERQMIATSWRPERLWDLHTPGATWELEVSLLDSAGLVLDVAWPVRTGFREFWIEGRDFYLNGTRVHLSAVPLDNALVGAAWAGYAGARESLERLQAIGINFVYTHNYGCEPGSHLGYEEILRAADDVGMLVGFSQPHFSHYDWNGPGADEENGYARDAAFYVRAAQNHPSVVMYPMSHNATGYSEDMNPDMIDGIREGRDEWARRNAARALRAEGIVSRLDPTRIVYHHAGGNLGALHTSNFYPNFVPIQELSDWFEHWATVGVKPVFTCEYGAPFSWDWTMYRGWYQGEREFGGARVPWEFCLAEWNAQFMGDRAYRLSEEEKRNVRWEAAQFRAGRVWHRWDYPVPVGSSRFSERFPVFARYINDNWRAFRTWGVSAVSPWDFGPYWRLREGVDRGRRELVVDWERLQRPGFSADYVDEQYERMDLAHERSDWVATEAAEALVRNNRPLLAYLAGDRDRFTSRDHNFLPGQTVEKQLVILNDSRESAGCEYYWRCELPVPVEGRGRLRVAPGEQTRLPIAIDLPSDLGPGTYPVEAVFTFATGETQLDALALHVLRRPTSSGAGGRVALWDPVGETAKWLGLLGIEHRHLATGERAGMDEVLVIGKGALTVSGPVPELNRVRDGLNVVVFEQGSEVLEKRLGFRVVEYGLRQVFPRVLDPTLLKGLSSEHFADWRGEATLVPPRLSYELRPRHGPTVRWCDLPVTRAWRCGNQGNVASVLIEKPARGDFLSVLDGGFSLQYSPLLEYREGQGRIVFCQMDVTGRTEDDPAAEVLTRNLLAYAAERQSAPRRTAMYVGEPAGLAHLEILGMRVDGYSADRLTPEKVLVAGPGAGSVLEADRERLTDWRRQGGRTLLVGMNAAELKRALAPQKVATIEAEYFGTALGPVAQGSWLAGVGSADVHNRDPRMMTLIRGQDEVAANDGSVAEALDDGRTILFQLAPWAFAGDQAHRRRTFRRVSLAFSRLLANQGVAGETPLVDRWNEGPGESGEPGEDEARWRRGLYLDDPVEWDDPYRFFRW